MPKLIIDQRELEVPKGTKVIEAAGRLGIMIPRFCYHAALGSLGACRMCAVKFLDGPVKGVDMSCMVDAADGMVVSTNHPEAVEFRRYVIEWLMLNHPHDCPVCDEGGHCLLQDETVSGGHGLRRYLGKKRTYQDQYLGPFVQHEMNRCIHCWRCRRFYQEFSGYRDLGAMQIGNRMYFGRFSDGRLESPFAGNLIDICPTGVYTDKPARFKGRRWDFEREPSLCLHCSLGCNTIASARYREMIRQEARFNEAVNGYFICDRGRFGFAYANHPERPRKAEVDGKHVSLAEALQTAADRLNRVENNYGASAVACLGSPRSSLEAQAQLTRLCRLRGWPEPHFFIDQVMARKVKKAVSGLDANIAVSMREMEEADFIMVAGADPLNEAPMLALALRQAYRHGATVAVIDPRPISLPLEFCHLPVLPGEINQCLSVLMKRGLESAALSGTEAEARTFYEALPGEFAANPDLQQGLVDLAQKLAQSRFPVVVLGTDIVHETSPALVAALVHLCRAVKGKAGLFYLLPGPNAFGAGRLLVTAESEANKKANPSNQTQASDLLTSLESGSLKALVLVECDPLWSFPGQQRLISALERLDLLVVLDYLPSDTAKRADIVLPTQTVFENEAGSFINQEGRLQMASPIHVGGQPISQVSPGEHPPRLFLDYIPGAEPRTAAGILQELASALSGNNPKMPEQNLWEWLAQQDPLFAGAGQAADRPYGLRLLPDDSGETFDSLEGIDLEAKLPGDHLELLLVEWAYGTEELSSYSPYIHLAEETPHLSLHLEDAERLGLRTGDQVALHLPGGSLTVGLKTFDNMAKGVMVLPRHRQLAWHKAGTDKLLVPLKNIEKQ